MPGTLCTCHLILSLLYTFEVIVVEISNLRQRRPYPQFNNKRHSQHVRRFMWKEGKNVCHFIERHAVMCPRLRKSITSRIQKLVRRHSVAFVFLLQDISNTHWKQSNTWMMSELTRNWFLLLIIITKAQMLQRLFVLLI